MKKQPSCHCRFVSGYKKINQHLVGCKYAIEKEKEGEWKQCCREEICRLWGEAAPEDLLWYMGRCPTCHHFIGLTQTSQEEAETFCSPLEKERI